MMAVSDREFIELRDAVKHLNTLLTGGDDPNKGVVIQLDRLIQLAEAAKVRENRILQFALLGVGSGLTGFLGFLASLALWWITTHAK